MPGSDRMILETASGSTGDERRDERTGRGRSWSSVAGHRAALSADCWRLVAAAGVAGAMGGLADEARAQDDFGRMVAIAGAEVIVGKTGPARGPAALHRFQRDRGGDWVLVETVTPPGTAEGGLGIGPSLARAGGRLAIASADPDMAIAAHIYRERGGELVHEAQLPLPGTGGSGGAGGPGGAAADFATVLRILSPPARTVAMDRDRAAVAVAGGGVHLYRNRNGRWGPPLAIPLPGPPSEYGDFGAAMALRRDETLIGAPSASGSGEVHIYRPAESELGNVTLAPGENGADSVAAGARFGASLAIEGSRLLVGAPGARQGEGLVYSYRRFDSGEWRLQQVIAATGPVEPPGESGGGSSGAADEAGTATPAEDDAAASSNDPARDDLATPAGFGATLALLGDELWVGAPASASGTGSLHRFLLRDGLWEVASSPIPGLPPAPGAALGAAIALGATIAVAGAPGTDGGYGAALVLTREPGGPWGDPVWLRPGGGPVAVTDGEVRCEEGVAAGFSCEGVDLLAFLPAAAIGAEPHERVSDLWGWTDPESGREYALVGRTGGAAIVDLTDPAAPLYMGVVRANPSGARDLKVYADHLFFTGDGAGDHGLVVFDLTRLRGAAPGPVEFEPDAIYRGIASAHNLVMDAESGFAYPVGASGGGESCGGGLHMVDVRDPKSPVFAGCFTDSVGLIAPGRTHDAQCVVYRGPDERFQGRQICFVSNETLLRIVDVTDKATPTPIGGASHPGVAYIHQGWLTDDHRYYYLDDELDEIVGTAPATRTFIYDVTELDDPIPVGSVDGTTAATDHNLYVKGDRMYQANYQAGFRLFDISDPEAPVEIGFFDTTPYEHNPPGFVGAWTAFPYFESGTVVVTSMYEGVFVLRPRPRPLIP